MNAIFQVLWAYYDRFFLETFCLCLMCGHFNYIESNGSLCWCFFVWYIFEPRNCSSKIPNWVTWNFNWHICDSKSCKCTGTFYNTASCSIIWVLKFKSVRTRVRVLGNLRDVCMTTKSRFPDFLLNIFANFSLKRRYGFIENSAAVNLGFTKQSWPHSSFWNKNSNLSWKTERLFSFTQL